MTPQEMSKKIKQLAKDVGYVDCGITSAKPFAEFAEAIDRRKQEFPEAAALYDDLHPRAFPAEQKFPAKSIVVCVHWYGKYKIPDGISQGIGRHYLFDRRNPECPDNDIPKRMKAGLRELGLRVKKGGVPERWAAVRAGVARFGRNNFVYTEKYGSWIVIETFRIDKELPIDEPTYDTPCPDSCGKCIASCPTGAITSPFCMRADHCIAYLTYSAPEPIDENLWSLMGPWIYGCDKCQMVCPLNEGKWSEDVRADWLEKIAPYLTDEALANMDEETYRTVINPAFWYIPPDNVMRWRKNAARAQKNAAAENK